MRSTEMMIRFLLPCTVKADRGAIDAAIEVAHSCGAILVPLSLQQTLKTEEVGAVQPETQHSQYDFLEIVQRQAAIMDVPLEWFEISTLVYAHNHGVIHSRYKTGQYHAP